MVNCWKFILQTIVRPASRSMRLEFVTFHSDKPPNLQDVHPVVKAGTISYPRMIDMLFRSIRLFHPQSTCTVLTDSQTSLKLVSRPFKRVNSNLDHSALMLSRSQAQLRHVQDSDFLQPLILIDSDILINSSLSHIFEQDFDIAVTWRASFRMPINGGLLILNNKRPNKTKYFFQNFIDIYEKRYAEQASWYGDQLALRDCIGLHHKYMAHEKIIEVNGCRILLLSCETHNFSPNNCYEDINHPLNEKCILHFKGARKRLMATFFYAWLRPRESSLPWAHFQSWLARKRLKRYALAEMGFDSATRG